MGRGARRRPDHHGRLALLHDRRTGQLDARRQRAVAQHRHVHEATGLLEPRALFGVLPDPRGLPVKDVMSRAVLCVSEEQTLSDVANLMNNKDVDRFPVVREGVVVGFLTRAEKVQKDAFAFGARRTTSALNSPRLLSSVLLLKGYAPHSVC